MKNLYNELMNLINSNKDDVFYFVDKENNGVKYRIFNYRLVNWNEFKLPGALSCRGTMFDVTDKNNPKLVCLPMDKFFNYEEGDVNHTNSEFIGYMDKLDGSLISSYICNDKLYLKSKTSLTSEQALDAMKWLDLPENSDYKKEIYNLTKQGFTCNFEWISPNNRIVVFYNQPNLVMLNYRGLSDGKVRLPNYYDKNSQIHLRSVIYKYSKLPIDEFVNESKKETSHEGYVCVLKSSDDKIYFIKTKNMWYVNLHRIRDSFSTDKNIVFAVIDECTDDAKSIFSDDVNFVKYIENIEMKVIPIYNHLIKTVEDFYNNNKDLDRKSYAIKAKNEIDKLMSLAMNLYVGKENDYKEYAKKNYKNIFDIQDNELDGE